MVIMEIALINEALFRENSPVKDDTIINKFIPYIILAQKLHIAPILGDALTGELQTQIKAASETGEPDAITQLNKALITMIAPPLSIYAVYQALPFHWAAILNKGITVLESENSKAVGASELGQLRRYLRDDAQVLAQQLADYLCSCEDSYPLWRPSGACGCAITRCGSNGGGSEKAAFNTGIYYPEH